MFLPYINEEKCAREKDAKKLQKFLIFLLQTLEKYSIVINAVA